ncbi:FAD binding domain-containing protein [Chloroflexota bacterium]
MVRPLKSFEYFEPEKVEEAVQILSKYGAKAKVLAGGLDLIPRMRLRTTRPEYVVNIVKIPRLDYIEDGGEGGLRIGALTSLRSIETSPVVKKDYIVLYEAIRQIASIQLKTTATAVGNLCVATPASDVAPPLIVLGSKFRIAGPAAERIVPVEDFFVGVNKTVLQTGEIVTEILIPKPPASTGSAFFRLVWTTLDISKVNVAASLTVSDNMCKEARISLGSVAPTPIRPKKAEEILKGQRLDPKTIEQAASAAGEEVEPINDVRATAEYRWEMTKVLTRRAIEKALERAKA